MLFSPLHHTFAPLADKKQCFEAACWLLCPWRWKRRRYCEQFRATLALHFHAEAFLFSTGREALLALLRCLKLQPDDEVIVQGYTCVAVVNAIRSAGGLARFADIDPETLNLTGETVQPVLTAKTRAVICQHTFGIPANTQVLRALCDKHNLFFIEDCAHCIADAKGPPGLGMLGDAVMLSFGRDKAISGVTGGALLLRDPALKESMCAEASRALPLPLLHIATLLCYPLLYALCRPLMGIRVGFGILALCKYLRLLPRVLTEVEKEGAMPSALHALPEPCAALALNQWKRLGSINDHRRLITKTYVHALSQRNQKVLEGITLDLPLQKFPIFVKNAAGIRAALKRRNIHLDDGWIGCVICPASVNLENMNYVAGSDPEAERASSMILNLPTHLGMSQRQAEHLCSALSAFLKP